MTSQTILRFRDSRLVLISLAAVFAGCGGGGGGGDGGGGGGNTPPPVQDTVFTYDVTLTAGAVTGGSGETGSGTATVGYNETQGEFEATVTLSGVSADGATLRLGYAGENGPVAYTLAAGSSADTWQLSSMPIPASDLDALQSGAMYVEVTTAAEPDGALRGQVLPTAVSVETVDLDAVQVAPGSSSTATARAWFTIDGDTDSVTIHAVSDGLGDADGASIRQAAAGDVGPVIVELAQDPSDPAHWLLETSTYTTEMSNAVAAGELYIEITTASLPDGAIRGQLIPDQLELVVTDLDGTTVVMLSAANAADDASGRVMTTLSADSLASHVNLYEIADVDAIELRQAPAGQNGPLIASYEQDINDANHWFLEIDSLKASVKAGLDNQGVYVSARTPSSPGGVARGQIITESSQAPPDDDAFVVVSIDPPNAAEVGAFPPSVVATLNRAPLPASVGPQAVDVTASGGDGSFGDGNETSITPSFVSASGNGVSISLAGIPASDDVYRVQLNGGGANGIVDTSGIPLDGDADGIPGGTFESAFEVSQPAATLSLIQETIFSTTCATSGCHSGANPPDGLLLTNGRSYSNIVNVASVQMPSLDRVEPGDPNDSYLVRKIRGTGIVANRMPLGGPPLSNEEIALIVRWVSEGAPNN